MCAMPTGGLPTPRQGRKSSTHCAYPGCNRKAANLHHVQYRSEGGSDDLENLVPYCKEHHVLVHSERGDFARWGQKGGQKTASSGKSLVNLVQFRDNPTLVDRYKKKKELPS